MIPDAAVSSLKLISEEGAFFSSTSGRRQNGAARPTYAMDSADDWAGRTARCTKAAGAKAEAEARKRADAASENLMVMVVWEGSKEVRSLR